MTNDLGRPWLNSPDRYVQYCPCSLESYLPWQLVYLIDTEGSCFDDDWHYWRAKANKKNVGMRPIKRAPIWMNRARVMPAEKPKGLKKFKQLRIE